MKKLLYIFMCLAMTQACIKENFPTSPNDVTEGEEVTLSLSVSVPGMEVATRALGEYGYTDGSHPSLWVVVFDQQGYLVEAAKAYGQKYTEDSKDHTTTTQFSVDLHATPEPCIIHYLLNYADNLDLAYGHESSLIGGLVVGPDQDVYWQRVVLPYGIVSPMKNDTKNPDYTKYVEPYVTNVPLIRNFAKITVTVDEKVDNFTLSGFYVLNRPKTGTVAPYSNGAFVNYQPALAADQSLYDALTGAGYVGSEPDGLEFTNKEAPAAANFSTNPTYLYENTAEDKNAVTTILIAGKFDSDSDKTFDNETVTYYKADLVTNDLVSGGTKYAHILRNFHYELKIKSVIASGKDIAGAMNAAANNNLSGAVEIKDLTNVTNGTAGIYVSFTDTTLVSSAPIVLKYKFLEDVSDKTSYSNDRVKISAEPGDVVSSTSKGSLITTPTTSSWYGYQELIINPQELPDYTKEQTIVLYDEATKLRREVLIRLRPKLTMEVQCDPKVVDAEAGESMTLNLMFDSKLNPALFPLDFTIESQTNASSSTLKQYISPAKTEVISVQTGKSIVPGYAGSKSYQYVKTLSYDDYTKLSKNADGQVIFPVAFVTNIAKNASTVYVRNQYFKDANDFFLNEAAALVDGGFYGAGNEVQLVFTATTAGTYTVTSNNLAVTKAMSEQKELAAGEVCEMTLYTSDWSDPVSVAITGQSSYSKSLPGVTRNKLAMKATSIKTSINNVETELGYQTFGVYNSETAAKAMTGSIGTAVSADMKTATGSILVRDGLAETTKLFFSYTDGSYVYVANAEAMALHEGAALTFAQYDLPLEMSATLEGEQYYGAGKTVTLNVTTNKAGTYTVTFTEVGASPSSTTKEIELAAGETSITYTTSTWSGKVTASVEYKENANPVTVEGSTRNVLYIKPASVTGDTGYYVSDVKMSTNQITSNNWNRVSTVATFSLDELRAGVEVQIDNLNSSTTYYFAYQYYSGMMNSDYRYESMTAADLANGTAMSFGNSY